MENYPCTYIEALYLVVLYLDPMYQNKFKKLDHVIVKAKNYEIIIPNKFTHIKNIEYFKKCFEYNKNNIINLQNFYREHILYSFLIYSDIMIDYDIYEFTKECYR